jgi:hypothetical protein
VDLWVVVWIKEFLLGHSQRVRVDRKLSEEVRVTSGVSQGSVLGPLQFLSTDIDKVERSSSSGSEKMDRVGDREEKWKDIVRQAKAQSGL